MKTAVILVSFNGAEWLGQCLESLLLQNPLPALIAVDNGSTDNSAQIIQDFIDSNHRLDAAFLPLGRNTGFTRGANTGMRKARELSPAIEAFLLLNQDAWMEENCLEAFATVFEEDPQSGVLGARILYPDGTRIQHAGAYLESPRMVGLHFGHHEKERPGLFRSVREVDFVTGAAMMIRRKCLEDIGFFNEVFSPGYYEDVDFCSRARNAGWKVLYVPDARLFHHESASFTQRETRLRLAHRNRLIFLLDRLRDEKFRALFGEAEEQFLDNQATEDELIAISGASLEVLARLRAFEKALGLSLSPVEREGVSRLFGSLRLTCRKALRKNISEESS